MDIFSYLFLASQTLLDGVGIIILRNLQTHLLAKLANLNKIISININKEENDEKEFTSFETDQSTYITLLVEYSIQLVEATDNCILKTKDCFLSKDCLFFMIFLYYYKIGYFGTHFIMKLSLDRYRAHSLMLLF